MSAPAASHARLDGRRWTAAQLAVEPGTCQSMTYVQAELRAAAEEIFAASGGASEAWCEVVTRLAWKLSEYPPTVSVDFVQTSEDDTRDPLHTTEITVGAVSFTYPERLGTGVTTGDAAPVIVSRASAVNFHSHVLPKCEEAKPALVLSEVLLDASIDMALGDSSKQRNFSVAQTISRLTQHTDVMSSLDSDRGTAVGGSSRSQQGIAFNLVSDFSKAYIKLLQDADADITRDVDSTAPNDSTGHTPVNKSLQSLVDGREASTGSRTASSQTVGTPPPRDAAKTPTPRQMPKTASAQDDPKSSEEQLSWAQETVINQSPESVDIDDSATYGSMVLPKGLPSQFESESHCSSLPTQRSWVVSGVDREVADKARAALRESDGIMKACERMKRCVECGHHQLVSRWGIGETCKECGAESLFGGWVTSSSPRETVVHGTAAAVEVRDLHSSSVVTIFSRGEVSDIVVLHPTLSALTTPCSPARRDPPSRRSSRASVTESVLTAASLDDTQPTGDANLSPPPPRSNAAFANALMQMVEIARETRSRVAFLSMLDATHMSVVLTPSAAGDPAPLADQTTASGRSSPHPRSPRQGHEDDDSLDNTVGRNAHLDLGQTFTQTMGASMNVTLNTLKAAQGQDPSYEAVGGAGDGRGLLVYTGRFRNHSLGQMLKKCAQRAQSRSGKEEKRGRGRCKKDVVPLFHFLGCGRQIDVVEQDMVPLAQLVPAQAASPPSSPTKPKLSKGHGHERTSSNIQWDVISQSMQYGDPALADDHPFPSGGGGSRLSHSAISSDGGHLQPRPPSYPGSLSTSGAFPAVSPPDQSGCVQAMSLRSIDSSKEVHASDGAHSTGTSPPLSPRLSSERARRREKFQMAAVCQECFAVLKPADECRATDAMMSLAQSVQLTFILNLLLLPHLAALPCGHSAASAIFRFTTEHDEAVSAVADPTASPTARQPRCLVLKSTPSIRYQTRSPPTNKEETPASGDADVEFFRKELVDFDRSVEEGYFVVLSKIEDCIYHKKARDPAGALPAHSQAQMIPLQQNDMAYSCVSCGSDTLLVSPSSPQQSPRSGCGGLSTPVLTVSSPQPGTPQSALGSMTPIRDGKTKEPAGTLEDFQWWFNEASSQKAAFEADSQKMWKLCEACTGKPSAAVPRYISSLNDHRKKLIEELAVWTKMLGQPCLPPSLKAVLPLATNQRAVFTCLARGEEFTSIIGHILGCASHQRALDMFADGTTKKVGDEALHKILRSEQKGNVSFAIAYGGTREIKCTAYCAKKFAAMRKLLVSEESLLCSLSRCSGFCPEGGKSRASFYITQDRRYLAKEISTGQLQHFEAIAYDYFRYVCDTLRGKIVSVLAKIIGVYMVSGATGAADGRYWILQENVGFPTLPIKDDPTIVSGIFDLKGAGNARRQASSTSRVKLDQDFVARMNEGSFVNVVPECASVLKRAVHNDTLFLSRCYIMDYSLLAMVDGHGTLAVGIIDYLQAFNTKKKAESTVKSWFEDDPTIIHPSKYKERFRAAIASYFLLNRYGDEATPKRDSPRRDRRVTHAQPSGLGTVAMHFGKDRSSPGSAVVGPVPVPFQTEMFHTVCMFLAARDVAELAACSKALRPAALECVLWSDIFRRDFPQTDLRLRPHETVYSAYSRVDRTAPFGRCATGDSLLNATQPIGSLLTSS